ncbi:hypothetical protein BJX63DRAFT_399449 [Aspergillus granulosus]|uniref:Uncharacterized protein n=1 Tax=Aspergillus granulosus TaxID=176169 RepID=A0ABR4H7C4_9EURO
MGVAGCASSPSPLCYLVRRSEGALSGRALKQLMSYTICCCVDLPSRALLILHWKLSQLPSAQLLGLASYSRSPAHRLGDPCYHSCMVHCISSPHFISRVASCCTGYRCTSMDLCGHPTVFTGQRTLQVYFIDTKPLNLLNFECPIEALQVRTARLSDLLLTTDLPRRLQARNTPIKPGSNIPIRTMPGGLVDLHRRVETGVPSGDWYLPQLSPCLRAIIWQ